MYSTCLFCNAALGANAAIEHFPVGRRLAYDAAAGRLWVVCKSCARWNLSPLETRWEAIEEAERLFRATKVRVASDNIGLARLKEGTELVRIGKPLRTEFAAWRYGDQFAKRHFKTWLQVSGSLAMVAGSGTLLMGSMYFGFKSGPLGLSTLGLGIALNGVNSVGSLANSWKVHRKIAATVRDADGQLMRLTAPNARVVTMIPTGPDLKWKLKVPRNRVKPAGAAMRLLGQQHALSYGDDRAYLSDDDALRALAIILPAVNSAGASKRGVSEAVAVIEKAPSMQHLLRHASTRTAGYRSEYHMDGGESTLGLLPSSLRLALEMSLHSDDERRAMEGELKELEQRWRDADAIAKIADGLLLPTDIDTQIQALRRKE